MIDIHVVIGSVLHPVCSPHSYKQTLDKYLRYVKTVSRNVTSLYHWASNDVIITPKITLSFADTCYFRELNIIKFIVNVSYDALQLYEAIYVNTAL